MLISSYRTFLMNRNIRYGTQGVCFTTAQIKLGTVFLIFYDPAKTPNVPTNRGDENGIIFIPKDQYIAHLDLLRNEAPMDIVTDPNSPFLGSLRTAEEEPIGEGE